MIQFESIWWAYDFNWVAKNKRYGHHLFHLQHGVPKHQVIEVVECLATSAFGTDQGVWRGGKGGLDPTVSNTVTDIGKNEGL